MCIRDSISPEDLSLYKIVESPREGVDFIKSYYSTYHSIRHVRGKLVVRLERELGDSDVEELNESFADIVTKGKIEKSKPFPDESNEPDLQAKPRLAFSYTASPSRLHEMILAINRMGAE